MIEKDVDYITRMMRDEGYCLISAVDYDDEKIPVYYLVKDGSAFGYKERFSNKVVTSFLEKHKTIYTKTTNWRTWRWPADETKMKTYEAANG